MFGRSVHVWLWTPLLWLTLSTVSPHPALSATTATIHKSRTTARELYEQGHELARKKNYDEALEKLQQAFFLMPGDRTLKRAVDSVKKKVALSKAKSAKAELARGNRSGSFALLVDAFELYPSRSIASSLKKMGYRRHRGAWRTQEEVRAFEVIETRKDRGARRRLNLDDGFRRFRTDHFRLLTNLPEGKDWDRWMVPVLRLMDSVVGEFRRVFDGLCEPADTTDALEVVLFATEDDYRNYLGRNRIRFSFKTAGFYSSDLRTSFFYRTAAYSRLRPTLIHELTHQLQDRRLRAGYPIWVAEGIAEYFESAIIQSDHTISVGRPAHASLRLLRSIGLDGGNYIPAAHLFRATSIAEPTGHVGQAYAQAWAWTYFFLHADLEHRQLFLECLKKEKELGGWRGTNGDVYVEAFEQSGFLQKADELFKEFVRGVPLTARRSR